jgi:hypothetical protein
MKKVFLFVYEYLSVFVIILSLWWASGILVYSHFYLGDIEGTLHMMVYPGGKAVAWNSYRRSEGQYVSTPYGMLYRYESIYKDMMYIEFQYVLVDRCGRGEFDLSYGMFKGKYEWGGFGSLPDLCLRGPDYFFYAEKYITEHYGRLSNDYMEYIDFHFVATATYPPYSDDTYVWADVAGSLYLSDIPVSTVRFGYEQDKGRDVYRVGFIVDVPLSDIVMSIDTNMEISKYTHIETIKDVKGVYLQYANVRFLAKDITGKVLNDVFVTDKDALRDFRMFNPPYAGNVIFNRAITGDGYRASILDSHWQVENGKLFLHTGEKFLLPAGHIRCPYGHMKIPVYVSVKGGAIRNYGDKAWFHIKGVVILRVLADVYLSDGSITTIFFDMPLYVDRTIQVVNE